MTRLGRIVIDDGGTIIDVDASYCTAMRTHARLLIGRNMLEFTAPADRERCTLLMQKLVADGGSIATMNRVIPPDTSHVWVSNRMTLLSRGDPGVRIEIVSDEAWPPDDWVNPGELLDIARMIFDSRRLRANCFASELFSDHAWDILLAAYISEAQGAVLTTADLHAEIGISLVSATRWLRALNAEGLLEYEDGVGKVLITSPFRLSGEAHRRFETFLSELYGRSPEMPTGAETCR